MEGYGIPYKKKEKKRDRVSRHDKDEFTLSSPNKLKSTKYRNQRYTRGGLVCCGPATLKTS